MNLRLFIPTVRLRPTWSYWGLTLYSRSLSGQAWAHLWFGRIYIFWPWPRFNRPAPEER